MTHWTGLVVSGFLQGLGASVVLLVVYDWLRAPLRGWYTDHKAAHRAYKALRHQRVERAKAEQVKAKISRVATMGKSEMTAEAAAETFLARGR
jgi:hypothetical protein